jgi:pyrophosphatase PpaX
MRINTILFDWDGTLARTLEVWMKTFQEAYASVGMNPSKKRIAAGFGNWTSHVEMGVKPEDIEEYEAKLEVVYERLEHVQLYPGASEALNKLHDMGYKLGLVSTSRKRTIQAALAYNKIDHLFETIITAEDTTKHKPDPAPIHLALEQLGSNIAETVFVGDSDKDLGAATNAKMPLLLFAPESHTTYYDLDDLASSPTVKAQFKNWRSFPYEKVA